MAADGEAKLVFPGLAGVYQRFSPYSYPFMRFATGAILLPHGIQKILTVPISRFAPNIAAKGLPFAEALAYLTTLRNRSRPPAWPSGSSPGSPPR
jgi:putative oxidoreductase